EALRHAPGEGLGARAAVDHRLPGTRRVLPDGLLLHPVRDAEVVDPRPRGMTAERGLEQPEAEEELALLAAQRAGAPLHPGHPATDLPSLPPRLPRPAPPVDGERRLEERAAHARVVGLGRAQALRDGGPLHGPPVLLREADEPTAHGDRG